MKTKTCLILTVAVGFLGLGLAALAADDVQSYSIPKGHPPISGSPGFEVNTAPIHWTIPAGWKELPATSIRIGNFLIAGDNDKKAEVAITSFPGRVGTELDNVNRWRREIGLEPLDQNTISSQSVAVDGKQGKLYDLSGKLGNTVVVALPQGSATWFFKLRGDKTIVDSAKPAFLEFLKSVRLTGNGNAMPAAADPHAGAMPPIENTGPQPKWNPPASWSATEPGPMVVKSFAVAGDNGKSARIAISVFPGDVGGALANVNRWRAQMGLAPIGKSQLSHETKSVPIQGGGAVLVDLSNSDPEPGQPSRMVAAIVPRSGSTWFYKMVGDDAVVAREKAGFVKFVQTAIYP